MRDNRLINQSSRFKQGLVIGLSFFIAYLLTIVPLPGLLAWLRPSWVLLTLLFWLIAIPHRLGIVFSWFIGLFLDLLTGGALGKYALLFTFIAFFVLRYQLVIRGFSALQKIVFVAALQTALLTIQYLAFTEHGTMHSHWLYWMPVFSTAIAWVLVRMLLRDIQLRYRIG